jgi:hypothetical protein
MIFGLENDTAHAILTDIAGEIKLGRKLEENVRVDNVVSGNFEVLFKLVKKEFLPEYAGIALRYYKREFRLMVMFWPDKLNILPTEPGCSVTIQNEALEIV